MESVVRCSVFLFFFSNVVSGSVGVSVAPSTNSSQLNPPKQTSLTIPASAQPGTTVSDSPLSSSNTSGPILVPQPVVQSILVPELNQVPTKISLYTRKNPISGHTIIHNVPATVELAHVYSNDVPTRIIVHGSFDGLDFGHWMRDMKQRFLDVEDSNIIVVDWSSAASNSNALTRLTNARVVGHQIAMILQNFIQYRGMKAEDVHIVAHGDGTFAGETYCFLAFYGTTVKYDPPEKSSHLLCQLMDVWQFISFCHNCHSCCS
jgi:hypothetical protein